MLIFLKNLKVLIISQHYWKFKTVFKPSFNILENSNQFKNMAALLKHIMPSENTLNSLPSDTISFRKLYMWNCNQNTIGIINDLDWFCQCMMSTGQFICHEVILSMWSNFYVYIFLPFSENFYLTESVS